MLYISTGGQRSATKSASHLSSTHLSLMSSNPCAHEAPLHSATASYSPALLPDSFSSINSIKPSPTHQPSVCLDVQLFLSPVHPPSCWLAPCSSFLVSSWWVSVSIVEGRSRQVQEIQVNLSLSQAEMNIRHQQEPAIIKYGIKTPIKQNVHKNQHHILG